MTVREYVLERSDDEADVFFSKTELSELSREAGVEVGQEFYARDDEGEYDHYNVLRVKDVRHSSPKWNARLELERRFVTRYLRVMVFIDSECRSRRE